MPAPDRKLSFRVVDAHIGSRLRQRRTELAISQKRLGPVRCCALIIAGTNLDSGRARAGSLFPICLDTATRQSFTSLINHLSVVDVSLTCTSYWASYNDSTGPGCDSAPQPRGISLADPTLSLDVKAPRARLGSPVLGNNLRRVSVCRLVAGFYEVIR